MAQLAQLTRAYNSSGLAQLVAAYLPPSVETPTFSSPADRGTLDIANCSYADNVFTFRSRWDNTANSTGARYLYAKVDGVNGLTPSFQVVRSNFGITVAATAKFMYSYDLVTWLPFTNRSSTSTYYIFSHDSAFIADTVYVALWASWPTGRTLPWIQSIEGSGYVSDTTSSSGYAFDTRDATVNEQGTTISATPLYAFKIAGPGGNAPDGNPKRNMVIFAGMHASEDVGNYAAKGAVEFLVSEDSQAQTVRAWFDTFVYPLVASAGRKGGGTRGDFQSGYMTSDINRSWNGSTFQTVVKHKAAVLADTGGAAAVFFDFHGDHLRSNPSSSYLSSTDFAAWATAIQTYQPGLSQVLLTSTGYSLDWAESALSPSISIIPEYVYGYAATTQAGAEAYGANHMRAIALLANQEYFGASLDVYGSLAVVETGADICSCAGYGLFAFEGLVAGLENGLDTAALVGGGAPFGLLEATETGNDHASILENEIILPSAQRSWRVPAETRIYRWKA